MDRTDRLHPAVVAPTYNNAETLVGILDRLDALGLPIVVVNDGSTDATPQRLTRWLGRRRGGPPVEVVRHGHNRGKAAALRSGFTRARRTGRTHAVTIDTDGQHDPKEIPALLAAARRSPAALVLGVRRRDAEAAPWLSLVGRRLSGLGIQLACGARLDDSQCGLRVYPLDLVEAVRCDARRFAYETEIIARAKWAGRAIVDVPVRSRYLSADRRVSHYRLWSDTLLCAAVHARLALGRCAGARRRPATGRKRDDGFVDQSGPCVSIFNERVLPPRDRSDSDLSMP